MNENRGVSLRQNDEINDPLTEILRRGADHLEELTHSHVEPILVHCGRQKPGSFVVHSCNRTKNINRLKISKWKSAGRTLIATEKGTPRPLGWGRFQPLLDIIVQPGKELRKGPIGHVAGQRFGTARAGGPAFPAGRLLFSRGCSLGVITHTPENRSMS
jgi:hypothetical protein